MISVCREVVELREELEERNYNITELNNEQLEEVSRILLKKFKIEKIPIDIVHAADIMGLELLKVVFKNNENNNVGGALAVSSKLQQQGYEKNKVIKVNKYNSQGHQRFTIVHEIYHYIFDSFFKKNQEEYYDVFYENSLTSEDENEKRANRFAAAFLMPKEEFIKEYLYLSLGQNLDIDKVYEQLADKFLVSQKAVEKRIFELGLSKVA